MGETITGTNDFACFFFVQEIIWTRGAEKNEKMSSSRYWYEDLISQFKGSPPKNLQNKRRNNLAELFLSFEVMFYLVRLFRKNSLKGCFGKCDHHPFPGQSRKVAYTLARNH